MSHYLEVETPASAELEALIVEMLRFDIPWEGPAEQVRDGPGDAWERRVGGEYPGLATVLTRCRHVKWHWRPDGSRQTDYVESASIGTAADGWAQVELAIRRQAVRR